MISLKTSGIKQKLIMLLMISPFLLSAQESRSSASYFGNPLFISLLVLIILLLIIIVGLSNALKSISQSSYLTDKLKEEKQGKDPGSAGKIAGVSIALLLLSGQLSAQTAAGGAQKWLIGGLNYSTFYFLVAIILLELACIASLLFVINKLVRTGETKVVKAKPAEKEITLLEALSDAVDVENEHEIMLDHDYDGIKELDNNLPPWWKYGFYLTIFVSVIYMINYHGAKTGDLQAAEYDNEIAQAKIEIEEYMKTAASNVDETTVKMLDNPSDLNSGKQIFVNTCSACHGKLGEGGVGPNMTDDYWIYSGGISDIFKTIKYGKPDKGMKSWKEDLSPMQIAQVSSYIKTLRGTLPPNPKAPQGDLYIEQGAAPADSTKTNDTLSIKSALLNDTAKVKK